MFKPSYNRIASLYDFLSRLVFGKSQIKAQTQSLCFFKDCKHLLIVGGGTGWILPEIAKVNTSTKITYVEYSSAMLALAKKKKMPNQVLFIEADAAVFKSETLFDGLITPFLFDNFDEQKATTVFKNLHEQLSSHGFWLYVDFVTGNHFWKKAMLKAMYLFFNLIGALRINRFTSVEPFFKKFYTEIERKHYYQRFIEAVVWQKMDSTILM